MTQNADSAYKKTAHDQKLTAPLLAWNTRKRLFVVLGLKDFTATIVAVRTDVVAHMRFTGGWLDCQLRSNQEIVRTVHAPLGWGFFILLNGHDNS